MNLQTAKLAVWVLAVLVVLSILAAGLSVTLADDGDGLLFEVTSPEEVAAVADIAAPDDSETAAAGVPPLIDVWYGPNQSFGHLGNPQRWVSILGRVSDGNGVKSLKYSLNGGPQQSVAVGPDSRRLAASGREVRTGLTSVTGGG